MTDDLISRQAAIDHLRNIIDATATDNEYNEGFYDGLEFCVNTLATTPSVQPERNFLSGLTAEEQYDKIKWLFEYGKGFTDSRLAVIEWLEKHSAQPDADMIHLQKEQAYMQGWEDGRKALGMEAENES